MHTPEPWKFVKHDYGMMNCGHIEGRDEAEPNNPQMHRTIAVVCNHAPMDICAENGKLLASAPKLKRDLEGCLDLCERLLASKTGHNLYKKLPETGGLI